MHNQQTAMQQPMHMNGLNVHALRNEDPIKADPSLARFQFRARNNWINGGENRSRIRDFDGAGRGTRLSQGPRLSSPTASRPFCSATTRAPTPSSSFCMRLPAV